MTTSESAEALVIERFFEAPVEVIWQMWTDPGEFESWYGPDGATVHVAAMDLHAGGRRLVRMEAQTPNGPMLMWFAGEHVEVVENERLVYTEFMSDEQGNPTSVPAGPDGHPTVTEVRVELSEVGGRTKMVMTHVGIPSGSPGAAGWTMAFAKLAVHVEART
jgi:uncharacterized protein YndB with AHSA1/START domain